MLALALATLFDNRPSSTWSDTYQTHPEVTMPCSQLQWSGWIMVLLYWVYWDREEQWAGYMRTERMEGLVILGQNINRKVILGQRTDTLVTLGQRPRVYWLYWNSIFKPEWRKRPGPLFPRCSLCVCVFVCVWLPSGCCQHAEH